MGEDLYAKASSAVGAVESSVPATTVLVPLQNIQETVTVNK